MHFVSLFSMQERRVRSCAAAHTVSRFGLVRVGRQRDARHDAPGSMLNRSSMPPAAWCAGRCARCGATSPAIVDDERRPSTSPARAAVESSRPQRRHLARRQIRLSSRINSVSHSQNAKMKEARTARTRLASTARLARARSISARVNLGRRRATRRHQHIAAHAR